jgi:hypothetical protein
LPPRSYTINCMSGMTRAIFTVEPSGLIGMNRLALYLNELKRRGVIQNWHTGRPVDHKLQERFTVGFDRPSDAAAAEHGWTHPVQIPS